eukprot:CAMPEP_0181233648 /NCGR_PEP_ID=MMETSP1096-20121128/36466_1 /TAXON_ID=156174 ORGANISM="Chrysochromulina ericina, Strain CCMP281" /NCGR_SAMPLE_ID=MMETSP1096 /ASSEMBLY_ACC=CAM_ASM_000453 /LENGTH=51 /DNA_ID=CAMNT_0023328199 /DNA_START=46 /DNA_END=201 /DNA_ORIENTATION=+
MWMCLPPRPGLNNGKFQAHHARAGHEAELCQPAHGCRVAYAFASPAAIPGA